MVMRQRRHNTWRMGSTLLDHLKRTVSSTQKISIVIHPFWGCSLSHLRYVSTMTNATEAARHLFKPTATAGGTWWGKLNNEMVLFVWIMCIDYIPNLLYINMTYNEPDHLHLSFNYFDYIWRNRVRKLIINFTFMERCHVIASPASAFPFLAEEEWEAGRKKRV